MKTEELRDLDAEELDGKLKDARRELYELRFKLAVGQLENHRQIRRVRKDIAQILTIVHQRRWEGWEEIAAGDGQVEAVVEEAAEAAPAVDTPEAEETEDRGAESATAEARETEAAPEAEAATEEPVAEAPQPKRPRQLRRPRKAEQEPTPDADDEESK